jgi:hypothetical protein
MSRVSAILKVGASKVRESMHNERLSKEVSHSSCTLCLSTIPSSSRAEKSGKKALWGDRKGGVRNVRDVALPRVCMLC